MRWLKGATELGLRGGLEWAVKTYLGPIPEVSEEFQKALEKEYELELYRAKYAGAQWVTTTTEDDWGGTYVTSGIEGGPALSKATRRRIADLDGHPSLAEHPRMIALILKLKDVDRKRRTESSGHLKGGMKFSGHAAERRSARRSGDVADLLERRGGAVPHRRLREEAGP